MKAKIALFDLPYKHRVWMNGVTFKHSGKTYRILAGAWIVKNGEVFDSIKFEEVRFREDDEPSPIYNITESEFFAKINI